MLKILLLLLTIIIMNSSMQSIVTEYDNFAMTISCYEMKVVSKYCNYFTYFETRYIIGW